MLSTAILSVTGLSSSVWPEPRPTIAPVDRLRLAEAFSLGKEVCDQVWSGWEKTPFSILLVTPDYEFLVRHDNPTSDFTLSCYDSLLESQIYFRKSQFQVNLLATFPAVNGVPTIVVGQAGNTQAKTSTEWVLTILHEHFHQYQMSDSNYFSAVNELKLDAGDSSGMWMLNYAFPYDSALIGDHFKSLGKNLSSLLDYADSAQFVQAFREYVRKRNALRTALSDDDFKYLSLQFWQEGVARYAEYRVGKLAANLHTPMVEFSGLPDFVPYNNVVSAHYNRINIKLTTGELAARGRISFYDFGAAEGLLLDKLDSMGLVNQTDPNWHSRYFSEKFFMDKYLPLK
jgi:hypothetical protein